MCIESMIRAVYEELVYLSLVYELVNGNDGKINL